MAKKIQAGSKVVPCSQRKGICVRGYFTSHCSLRIAFTSRRLVSIAPRHEPENSSALKQINRARSTPFLFPVAECHNRFARLRNARPIAYPRRHPRVTSRLRENRSAHRAARRRNNDPFNQLARRRNCEAIRRGGRARRRTKTARKCRGSFPDHGY